MVCERGRRGGGFLLLLLSGGICMGSSKYFALFHNGHPSSPISCVMLPSSSRGIFNLHPPPLSQALVEAAGHLSVASTLSVSGIACGISHQCKQHLMRSIFALIEQAKPSKTHSHHIIILHIYPLTTLITPHPQYTAPLEWPITSA